MSNILLQITDIKKDDHKTKMGTCIDDDKIKNNNEETEKNNCRHTDVKLAGYNKYFYHFLGKRYCNTDDGMDDDWCSCYNIMANKCESNPDIPGCSDTKHELTLMNSMTFRSSTANLTIVGTIAVI